MLAIRNSSVLFESLCKVCSCYASHREYRTLLPRRNDVQSSVLPIVVLSRTYKEPSFFEKIRFNFRERLRRIKRKIGFLQIGRPKLRRTSYYLYEGIVDHIDYASFFNECSLSDTYFSWYLITELHVWMLMARLNAEGDEGKFCRKTIVKALWDDSYERAGKVADISSTHKKEQLLVLGDQLYSALFQYDEGILKSDKELAGALWRRVFEFKCDDPRRLEILVEYVRRQMQLLDEIHRDELLIKNKVTWLPLLDKGSKVFR